MSVNKVYWFLKQPGFEFGVAVAFCHLQEMKSYLSVISSTCSLTTELSGLSQFAIFFFHFLDYSVMCILNKNKEISVINKKIVFLSMAPQKCYIYYIYIK